MESSQYNLSALCAHDILMFQQLMLTQRLSGQRVKGASALMSHVWEILILQGWGIDSSVLCVELERRLYRLTFEQ